MQIKKFFTLSNLLYTASILFALGILLKTYLDRSNLPAGVCPYDNNRGLMIVAIVLLLLVSVVTSIMDHKKKRG